MESFIYNLEPEDNKRLLALLGVYDANIKYIEKYFNVKINNRGFKFNIIAKNHESQIKAKNAIQKVYAVTEKNLSITEKDLHAIINSDSPPAEKINSIYPKSSNQKKYLSNLQSYAINFATGPAGTGKTYVAVAYAVQTLKKKKVKRIIITRPAIEAGEKLGFLPGDLFEKTDPYLRPIYDALYDLLSPSQVSNMISQNIIEIAPLAYMRGRTLSDAFIILDEAQNTTPGQLKMFLTRIGFNSTAIITGDLSQVDLPRNITSGLKHALSVLKSVEGIGYTFFETADVCRHPLVGDIINAYNNYENPNLEK